MGTCLEIPPLLWAFQEGFHLLAGKKQPLCQDEDVCEHFGAGPQNAGWVQEKGLGTRVKCQSCTLTWDRGGSSLAQPKNKNTPPVQPCVYPSEWAVFGGIMQFLGVCGLERDCAAKQLGN